MAKSVAFIDSEIGVEDKKIYDLGAVRSDRSEYHGTSAQDFCTFISEADFLCGHNIVHHDMKFLAPYLGAKADFPCIDTLYVSPLLFPQRPYHRLLKDDKLQSDELNNPLNDAKKAEKLFYDEVSAFQRLSSAQKQIFCCLNIQFHIFSLICI